MDIDYDEHGKLNWVENVSFVVFFVYIKEEKKKNINKYGKKGE